MLETIVGTAIYALIFLLFYEARLFDRGPLIGKKDE